MMQLEKVKSMTIHRLFEQQAAGRPNQVAIKFNGRHLTYRQLNERANFVAKRLIDEGTRAGDIVALSMSRTVEMIVAILAILKAGAAYLPLDGANPLQRKLYCLKEADVKIVISDEPCDNLLENGRIAITTAETFLFNSVLQGNLELDNSTNDKCYIMYTSGSTGSPKGVVVPHRAVIRLVNDPDYITIEPSDCILQFAPLSFDASTFEIWGALLNGAALALYSGATLDPNLLLREIKQNDVSIMWLTAALFHLIASRYIEALAPLKTLLAGGDVLYPKLINKVLDFYPEITVINGYGPTENTTFTCCHRITVNNRPDTCVPIGKAIKGTSIHILNEQLKPAAPGQQGELFVSGQGVALGYMNSFSNEDNFFVNETIAEGLIYRTGDLVRENEHGNILFIGRKDNQVKVRGYRVSLEEIQNNILKLDKVNEAVVLLSALDTGDQQLVAYLQLENEHGLNAGDIKKALAIHLPKYMVPDIIHINKEFPFNKNGKIDKRQFI